MKRSCIFVLSGLVALACSSAPAPQSTAVPDLTWDQVDAADGKTLYEGLCASCHGADARGEGPVAEDLTVPMPDLTLLTERNGGKFPLARVEAVIYGPDTLEIHGTLTQQRKRFVGRGIGPDACNEVYISAETPCRQRLVGFGKRHQTAE